MMRSWAPRERKGALKQVVIWDIWNYAPLLLQAFRIVFGGTFLFENGFA